MKMGKTYIASRIAKGNRLFPCKIILEQEWIKIRFPGFFQGHETFIPYCNIASVSIDTPMIGYSTIKFNAKGINTTAHGFTISEARSIQKFIQNQLSKLPKNIY